MKKIFFLFLIGLTIQLNAQTIPNKLNFQKGQKFEVYTQMNRTSTQEMMGQTMESSFTSATTSLLDVNDLVENNAVIEHKVKRIKLDASFFGRTQNFDSDNKEDLKDDMGKMLGSVLNEKYSMTVDATGKIVAVKQEEEKNKKAKKDDEAAAGMMGMLSGGSMNTGVPKAGDPTIFKILPEKEIAKGEKWTEESKDKDGSKKGLYTVTDITENEILIDFTEDADLNTKQTIMGQEASISVKSKSTGKIILDKTTRLLKQKTFLTTSEENINAAGMTMPATSKMTTTVTVKAI